jgi:hypothetical protein
MGDRHGDLLVRTLDDLHLVVGVVHQGVIQPAERRARIEGEERKLERTHGINHDVGTVGGSHVGR